MKPAVWGNNVLDYCSPVDIICEVKSPKMSSFYVPIPYGNGAIVIVDGGGR